MRAEVALGQGVAPVAHPPDAPQAPTALASAPRSARPLWQVALAAWLGQRLLIGALVVGWQLLLGTFSPAAFAILWTEWDASWFISIAQYGYTVIAQAAYFPLFPLLAHVLAPALGGRIALAGFLLNNGFSLVAFLLLGVLVERESGAHTSHRALLYYALFPTGLFLISIYSEGLFLLLSVGAFLCLRQRRWLLAVALIALATLTRAQGILLALPLLIEAWRALAPTWRALSLARRLRAVALLACAVAAPLLAFLGWQLYLAHLYGVPDVLNRAARDSLWKRYPDWPWAGGVSDIAMLFTRGAGFQPLQIIRDLLFLAFWLGLCLIMLLPYLRRLPGLARLPHAPALRGLPALPFSWVAYSWASLLEMLVLPAHTPSNGVMSAPRYALVVFPCFALMALLGERYPRAHRLMVALCVAWVIIMTRMLVSGIFVA